MEIFAIIGLAILIVGVTSPIWWLMGIEIIGMDPYMLGVINYRPFRFSRFLSRLKRAPFLLLCTIVGAVLIFGIAKFLVWSALYFIN